MGTRRLSASVATWSGQVISSPPGPSGGPYKPHLLPGVPRVHRVRSPVRPRLLLFATPRSVHQFAAVAAGAYPLRRPPNAWSPGAPALPGPCYWLVASGTPLGWRGGCLALGLGHGAVRNYCLGGCSALAVCARRSRPVRRARAGTWCRVSPVSPFPPRVSGAVCGGPSRPGVPYPRSLVRHSTRSVRSASSVRLPFWYFPRALCVCVHSRSRGVRSPPPLPRLVWRAHLARSRRWALVGPFHAVRAPPRVLPRSLAPFGVLGGGRPVRFPPYLAWGCALPVGSVCAFEAFPCQGVGWGGGGRPVRRAPRLCGRGGQWGGGSLCLVPSLCLPRAGNKAGVTGVVLVMEDMAPILLRFVLACRLRARSVWRPGALARVCLFSAVPVRAGSWGGGAGLAPAPLSGAAVLAGIGGTIPSASGGVGADAPAACGHVGGVRGGRSRRGPPALPLGGGLRFPTLPPSRRRRIPPRRARSVGVAGPPRAPGAACLAGGGGGLGWVGLDSPDLKNATDPSIEKFGSPGSGAIFGVV